MTEIISTKTVITIGKKLYPILQNARRNLQERRLEEFAKCVDLRYEFMTVEDQCNLQKFIESDIGQEKIEKFTHIILETSCKRVLMATALLHCCIAVLPRPRA